MKLENEITVLVKTDYKSLLYELAQNGFIQKEEYADFLGYYILKEFHVASQSKLIGLHEQ